MPLVLVLALALALQGPLSLAQDGDICSSGMYRAGVCPQIGLTVSASQTRASPAEQGVASSGYRTEVEPDAPRPCIETDLTRCELVVNTITDTPEAGQGSQPITITDLAAFTPAVGELIVQPENWGVLGVPTNFVATATDHVQDGTLLGQPIQVRWRPTSFTFDYGDGSVMTTSDSGAQWQGTDDDWTGTTTSHAYQARGDYAATVTITFEADIGNGAGWTTVPGTLDLAAPAESVQIFQAQTVLTRGDCIDYPDDPGCSG